MAVPFIMTDRGIGLGSENQDVCFYMLTLKRLLGIEVETGNR